MKMTELLPLKVYPFTFNIWGGFFGGGSPLSYSQIYTVTVMLPLAFKSPRVLAVTDFLLQRSELQTLNGLDDPDMMNSLKTQKTYQNQSSSIP